VGTGGGRTPPYGLTAAEDDDGSEADEEGRFCAMGHGRTWEGSRLGQASVTLNNEETKKELTPTKKRTRKLSTLSFTFDFEPPRSIHSGFV
jgi:hypothetical protein